MIDSVATFIGYTIIVSGGIGLAAFLVCCLIGYAWKRFGDVNGLIKVLREAKRQGRSVIKSKESNP